MIYFSSFSDFISMQGHGIYVWSCYAIAFAVILFNIVSPQLKSKAFFTEQARQLRRERHLAERSNGPR